MQKKCQHNRREYLCKECGGKGICEHNRNKSRCKDCGGKGICEHKIEKRRCRVCGGSDICKHNKRKALCRECGGGSFCEHNRVKSNCKDCGGSQICEHNRLKSVCKECGGSSICEHNKIKINCKECGGSQICEHKKLRYDCKDCGGKGICDHNIKKTYCKECDGSQICEHDRVKSQCKQCHGSSFCEHNRQRARCKECHGCYICKHDKVKSHCKECGGSQLCKSEWCSTISNPKYDGYCMVCFIHLFPDRDVTRNYKTKERTVVEYVFENFPRDKYSWISDKRVYDGCSKRRPDLFLDLGYQVIIIEIDENQHTSYDCSCENKRLMEISQDINHRPLIFIRFNPDDYTTNEGNITSCWNYNKLGVFTIKKTKQKEWQNRLDCLCNQIEYWCQEENKTNKTVEVIHLFYDTVTSSD